MDDVHLLLFGGKDTRKSCLSQILRWKKMKNLDKPTFYCIFAPKNQTNPS